MELHEIVDANNHHGLFYSVVTSLSWHSEHLERLLSLESLLQTIALIISWIGDKHTKFSILNLSILNLVKVQKGHSYFHIETIAEVV